MRNFILEYLTDEITIEVSTIILNNLVACMAAFFIMFTYKITYTGTAYSRKFNVTLGTITIVTTMIMSVISNNVALSLGMVGALSIIRYRTAIKDVRDASYIFWAIAVGIGCGVSQYALIGIGSVFLLLFMLLTKQGGVSGRKLLIVYGKLEAQNQIEATTDAYFKGKISRVMKNATEQSCEVIYSVSERELDRADEREATDITQELMKISGVSRVNLVDQTDDISR